MLQRDAERDRDVAVAALQELEQKYRDYEHDTLHDLQALRKDCLQAETDASHLQVSLREMTDQYEKAQARLTKEREVAFQITTDLKDELDRVKVRLVPLCSQGLYQVIASFAVLCTYPIHLFTCPCNCLDCRLRLTTYEQACRV